MIFVNLSDINGHFSNIFEEILASSFEVKDFFSKF
jgi:hypothetical protein